MQRAARLYIEILIFWGVMCFLFIQFHKIWAEVKFFRPFLYVHLKPKEGFWHILNSKKQNVQKNLENPGGSL